VKNPAHGILGSVEPKKVLAVPKHPAAVMKAVLSPSTADDQSRTWDGRVLNTKEAMLEFLDEIEETRRSGRSLDPHDDQP